MEKLGNNTAVAQICVNKLMPEGDGIPVTASSDLGIRVYRDTLCFMFETAVNNVFKFRHCIRLGNSIGDGYYFYFADGYEPSEPEVTAVSDEMSSIQRKNIKIETLDIEYNDAIDIFEKRKMPQTVHLLETLVYPSVKVYKACDTYTIAHNDLMGSFGLVQSYGLMKYNDGFLLRYPRKKNNTIVPDDWHDNKLLYQIIKKDIQNIDVLSIDSIGMLNHLVANNGIREYIDVSENLQRRRIMEVADRIKEKKTVQHVFVAGPSSSNKTTFASKLCVELKVLGFEPLQISLDDYYFTKDKVPRNEYGEPDLECLGAIDTELFKKNLKELYEGREVNLPHFEFNYNGIGRRTFAPNAIKLKKNNILVIEGIHALNNELTVGIDKGIMFHIYISPLIQLNLDEYTRIRTTDLRILRRLVRDFRTRNATALETLSMWGSVENGERKYIFPFQNDVDVIFSSAHSYEIGVMATYAIPLLRTVPPENLQCYIAAQRLIKLLGKVNPIPESYVPDTSMLREFIGGL